MSENNEVMEIVDETEEVIDQKPTLKERIFKKENIKKGLKIAGIVGGAITAVFVLGKIATPDELDYPEEVIPYDEGGSDGSDI